MQAAAAPAEPHVRLDSFDVARGGRSFAFRGYQRTLIAASLEEVLPLLAEVEAAAAAGLHAVGFVAYEAAPAFDAALATRDRGADLPLAWFALFRERVEQPGPSHGAAEFELGSWEPAVTEAEYRAVVGRLRELIAAGDTYQVNYTFPLRAPFSGDPLALYAGLCLAQRSAFCAYLDTGPTVVVSASPELFFHREGDALTLRPMKGTRPRGRWSAEDDALAAELVASPKERAENLMIVDLLRNDAGRVAVPGTVTVERLFEVERYETVHQMTSTIRARTRPGVGLGELFGALFPCGSVTGAPKVRTMQIIAGAEQAGRGVYCGAIGFVSPGEAMFSVGIRTVAIDRAAGEAVLGVGSGITWDAEAGAEYAECLGKAAFARPARAGFELLETLRYQPGPGFILLDGHLRRMEESARRFGFAFDRRAVFEALHAAVRDCSATCRVRVMVGRDGLPRVGVDPLGPDQPLVTVGIARSPVDPADPLLYHKTTRREVYESRRAEAPGCDDVLLVNTRGELTESSIANLVLSIDGRLVTPPVESGLLAGVFRAELLRRREISERIVTLADLRRAEGVWLINSVRGWRRAVASSRALA